MDQQFYPPAFCREHGIFPATGFSLRGRMEAVSFTGCTTTCPRCGGHAEVIPGLYNSDQDRLNILVDKSISPEALAAIRRIAVRLQQGELSLDQAKAEAEKISPKAGRLFDIANWSDQAKATLYASIIGAIAAVTAAKIASSPTQMVNVQPVIERVIEVEKPDLRSSTSLTPPSDPLPIPPRKPARGSRPKPRR